MIEPLRPGSRLDGEDREALASACEAIVDYRGDVTITRRSTTAPIAGYVFDCPGRDTRAVVSLRLLPEDGGRAIDIPLDDVVTLEVTGRDTAEGKSFETWVNKYVQQKLRERDAANPKG